MNKLLTEYKFPQKFYFERIIKRICFHILNSNFNQPKIIDYGCGLSTLELFLNKYDPSISVEGYDIDQNLSKLSSPFLEPYDIWVINHVLMYMDANEIAALFERIKNLNKNASLIIGISRQNLISKLGAYLLSPQAHDGTVSSPSIQKECIDQNLVIYSQERIFTMTDLFVCKFF